MVKEKANQKRGVSLMLISSIFVLISLVLSASIIIVTRFSHTSFEQINRISEGYIKCTEDVQLLDETSDFLTSKSREYVVLNNPKAAVDYMQEVTESKARERSVENVKVYFADTEVGSYMQDALDQSNLLAVRELYAMRLAGETYGVDALPTQIKEVTLTAEDLALDNNAKVTKATTMLFDEGYDSIKSKIDDDIAKSLTLLIEATSVRKEQANRGLNVIILFHESLAVLLFLFVLATGAISYFLMVLPLKRYKEAIENNKRVEVIGSRELRFVAQAYNHMYDAKEKHQEALQYEVSHDILTGIFNRREYLADCARLAKTRLYFIIADVDRFKGINDTYGHDLGDKILRLVARKLRGAFPEPNYVFRVGGDEFIIFATEEDLQSVERLENILDEINQSLDDIHQKENIPLVSLSFGIVDKTPDMTFDDAYRDADKALYRVKEAGGCGVDFNINKDSDY